jgi:hypothetical protein
VQGCLSIHLNPPSIITPKRMRVISFAMLESRLFKDVCRQKLFLSWAYFSVNDRG